MIFGSVPVEDAKGAILAHGVSCASLEQGITLGDGHIASLRAFGIGSVMAARLDRADIGQDAAAMQIAQAVVPDASAQGVRLIQAGEGRINIISHRAGLLRLKAGEILALNTVDPMMTLATLPDLQRVRAGVVIAVIHVMSYGVAQDQLARMIAAIAPQGQAPTITIQSAVLTTATLIETYNPGHRPQPRARRVFDDRVDRLGANLIEVLNIPHEGDALHNAILAAKGEVVCILTAQPTRDIHDIAPAALVRAGGTIAHFGMPVDPGGLMFFGECNDHKPLIGLPECARSPALNGADWVLERVICGVPFTAQDINARCIGGLLNDMSERGRT